MTMLPIGTSAATPTVAKSKSQSELGTTDFLRLMTEQLKQQDPFAPTDNTQMVAQMAQMSSSSGIAEMNASLKGIAAQLADQTALLQSLVAPAPTPATTN
jgi:flagellar hook assembly protein FlgD